MTYIHMYIYATFGEPQMGLVEMGLQENQKLGTPWTIGDAGSHCMRS